MSDATPGGDPFEQMRKAYDEAVATWAKAMEQMVASDEFAAASGQFLRHYAQLQETLRGASRSGADGLNLPTKDDLASVAQLVINVERKVDEVSDEAHAVATVLADVLDRLDRLEARLVDLAPAAPAAKAAPAKRSPRAATASPEPRPRRARAPKGGG